MAVTTAVPASAATSTGAIVPASTPPSVTVTAPVPATCGDSMVAVDTQGRASDITLKGKTLSYTTPTKWFTRDLKTAGWAGFRQFSTMFCGDKGRIIMGYHDNRTVGVSYDPNSYDFNGGDITGRMTTLPALPAGTLAYG
ncbi:hypothetical protein [Micrococcus sp. IITD107]|uniref:hypothetical protein n=1 Tax=Micrococcus sp. IITD107 TaxID=3342790 RepID=UPI0035B88F19